MHGSMMATMVLGLSVTMLAGTRKSEPPAMSKSLKSLAEVCEKQRGISAEAFERHLARNGSAAWTIAVVGEDSAARRAMVESIAKAIGVSVIIVDPAELVGTYIGETEKNLDQLLKTAEEKDAVLLFDEADALFGKRTEVRNAHDKYGDEGASTIPARVRDAQTMVIVGLRTKVPRTEGLRDAVVAAPEPSAESKPIEPPWRSVCWPPRAN